jgi:hypothetical protein
MTSNSVRKSLAMASVASLAMFTAACGSDSETDTASGNETTTEAPSDSANDTESSEMEPAMANLSGPGCADYAEAVPSGDGSIDGMAQDPVATAASNNPLLKTLASSPSSHPSTQPSRRLTARHSRRWPSRPTRTC